MPQRDAVLVFSGFLFFQTGLQGFICFLLFVYTCISIGIYLETESPAFANPNCKTIFEKQNVNSKECKPEKKMWLQNDNSSVQNEWQ